MIKSIFTFLACLLLCFIHSGCKKIEITQVSPADFIQKDDGGGEGGRIASLVPGDAIEISVEVDGRMEVTMHRTSINHLGMVTLPLVGDTKVGGLTVGSARAVIAETYGAYFVHPPVIMISRAEDSVQGEWGFVTVTGQVAQPGRVKIESAKGIKLTSVIQNSGGFSSSAKKSDIRVSRTDADGRIIRTDIDYTQIGQKGNLDADIDLKDGAVVYVPQRIF